MAKNNNAVQTSFIPRLTVLKVWLRPAADKTGGRKAVSLVVPANRAELVRATLETCPAWGDRVSSLVSYKVSGSKDNFTPKFLLSEQGEFLQGDALISAFARMWNLA